MEAGKIDRRRRYTLSVIREAFFALLAEAGFAKMTVADICRRADFNRVVHNVQGNLAVCACGPITTCHGPQSTR